MKELTYQNVSLDDIEDGSTDTVKPYFIKSMIYEKGYDTIEDAEAVVMKDVSKRPWGNEQIICEVRKIIRGVPEGEVKIQTVDVRQALENKTDE